MFTGKRGTTARKAANAVEFASTAHCFGIAKRVEVERVTPFASIKKLKLTAKHALQLLSASTETRSCLVWPVLQRGPAFASMGQVAGTAGASPFVSTAD